MSRKPLVLLAIAASPLLLIFLSYQTYRSLQGDRFVEREVRAVETVRAQRRSGTLLTVASPPSPSPSRTTRPSPSPTRSPVVAASPSPDALPEVAELLEYVRNDDVCGLWLQGQISSVPRETLATLIREMRGSSSLDPESRLLVEMYGLNTAEEMIALLQRGTSDATRFYRALLQGGLLQGAPRPRELALPEAREELDALARKYPENGIFALALLVVEQALGADSWRLDELVASLAQAQTIDGFENTFARDVLETNLGSAAEMIVALTFNSGVATPDTTKALPIIRDRVAENPELARSLVPFGRSVMDAEESRADGLEFTDWSAVNFVMGRSIAKTGWRYSEGNESFPPDIDRDYRALIRRSANPGFTEATGRLHGEQCDRDGVDHALRLIINRPGR